MSEPTTAELMVQLREYQMNLAQVWPLFRLWSLVLMFAPCSIVFLLDSGTQVNALVLTDPMNPEYLELKKSLIEGITLATSLVGWFRDWLTVFGPKCGSSVFVCVEVSYKRGRRPQQAQIWHEPCRILRKLLCYVKRWI
jgi:hypothetical protein